MILWSHYQPIAPLVMPSKSSAAFADNKKDIERLWAIHEEVAGSGRGRKHGVEILNRATLVFIAACWEAYVEDLALEVYGMLHTAGVNPHGTPRNPGAAKNRADTLHTPFAAKVDALFRDILGLEDISLSWSWQNMSASQAVTKLDGFIADRCEVAHRVSGQLPTPKSSGSNFLDHVTSIVECTEEAVLRFAQGLLRKPPW
jgi:hypothetical protein